MSVQENFGKIQASISELEKEGFQFPEIVAITKYASDEQVIESYQAGLRIFGENYVIPALDRKKRLYEKLGKDIEWHLTGHLQKNKLNKAVGNFDLIQSVDSVDLLELINSRAKRLGIIQRVLLQINISKDQSKRGFYEEDILKLWSKLFENKNIFIEGLMTITAKTENPGTFYEGMRLLRDKLSALGPGHVFDGSQKKLSISMGMSEDYLLAIRQGASIIRLGQALFA
jgi:PLP dependent protein